MMMNICTTQEPQQLMRYSILNISSTKKHLIAGQTFDLDAHGEESRIGQCLAGYLVTSSLQGPFMFNVSFTKHTSKPDVETENG